jgi:hypothetical protein
MQKFAFVLVVGAVAVGSLAQPAQAVKQFSDQFNKLYNVDKKDKDPSDFAKAVLEAKCYNCHQGKKSKHNRNRYGAELAKLLDKKKDAKNPAKIIEALETVAKIHTDPSDPNSPTYGDLIQAGQLPGGPLADSKQEPPKGSGHDEEHEHGHDHGHDENGSGHKH